MPPSNGIQSASHTLLQNLTIRTQWNAWWKGIKIRLTNDWLKDQLLSQRLLFSPFNNEEPAAGRMSALRLLTILPRFGPVGVGVSAVIVIASVGYTGYQLMRKYQRHRSQRHEAQPSSSSFSQTVDCEICREPLYDPVELLSCGHLYHRHCIREWMEVMPECMCGKAMNRMDVKRLKRWSTNWLILLRHAFHSIFWSKTIRCLKLYKNVTFRQSIH